MATVTVQRARDRFLAQVELANERLDRFDRRLADISETHRETFQGRSRQIAERCSALKEQILAWPEVQVGTAGAVDDLGSALDTLEADYDAASEIGAEAYRSAVDRQLRSWRTRSDQLRVQGALATMELRDDLDAVGARLADARAGVLLELRNAASDAREIVIDLRSDIEDVLVDVRHAVERAADAFVDRDRS